MKDNSFSFIFAILIVLFAIALMPSCAQGAPPKPLVLPKTHEMPKPIVPQCPHKKESTNVVEKVVEKSIPPIPIIVELPLEEKVIEIAKSYLYLRETTNHNDAPEIDAMLAYQGLPKGLSWCLAFCVWDYYKAAESLKIKNPLPKMARVSQFYAFAKTNQLRFKVIYPDDVKLGAEKLQKADVACFSHGKVAGNNNWNGHAALVVSQIDRKSFNTIEGNTGPDSKGSQREGGGVFLRVRAIGMKGLDAEGFVRPRPKK